MGVSCIAHNASTRQLSLCSQYEGRSTMHSLFPSCVSVPLRLVGTTVSKYNLRLRPRQLLMDNNFAEDE